jgi:DNA-binding GntR family transcriptional regulator
MVLSVDELRRLVEQRSRTGLPKYLVLREALIHAVSRGTAPPGTRLPAEHELADVLPMSLGTIQRALRQLADERLITRTPGAGSFVSASPGDAMSAPFHCRFVRDDGNGYLPVFAEVIERCDALQDGPWARHLGGHAYVCLIRRIRIGDEFSVHSAFYIDAGRMPVFARAPTQELSAQNFKELMWRTTGKTVGRIDLLVSTARCSSSVAKVLRLKSGELCMVIEARAFFGSQDPAYYQRITIPPNSRQLHIVTDGRDPGLGR